jgi:preprotein translocase subunit Sec63
VVLVDQLKWILVQIMPVVAPCSLIKAPKEIIQYCCILSTLSSSSFPFFFFLKNKNINKQIKIQNTCKYDKCHVE